MMLSRKRPDSPSRDKHIRFVPVVSYDPCVSDYFSDAANVRSRGIPVIIIVLFFFN